MNLLNFHLTHTITLRYYYFNVLQVFKLNINSDFLCSEVLEGEHTMSFMSNAENFIKILKYLN